MRRFLASRPSPAMAVAFVALLAALSGTAIALPGTNSVDSGDIKNGQVKGKDVGRNAVTGKKVKNRSLTGADVRDNSLTGADINEATLGQVPSANTANSATSATSANTANTASNANAVNGVQVIPLNFAVEAEVGDTVLLNNVNGLTITASCAAGPVLSANANTSVDGAQFQTSSVMSSNANAPDAAADNLETANEINDDDFLTTDTHDLLADSTDFQQGTTSYTNPNGKHVTVHWTADQFPVGPDCEFTGFAFAN
jgi:hypothetical protein